MNKTLFRKDLQNLINIHSIENGSNTPDFILADYLMMCLSNFEKTVKVREKWYGRDGTFLTKDTSPTTLSSEIFYG